MPPKPTNICTDEQCARAGFNALADIEAYLTPGSGGGIGFLQSELLKAGYRIPLVVAQVFVELAGVAHILPTRENPDPGLRCYLEGKARSQNLYELFAVVAAVARKIIDERLLPGRQIIGEVRAEIHLYIGVAQAQQSGDAGIFQIGVVVGQEEAGFPQVYIPVVGRSAGQGRIEYGAVDTSVGIRSPAELHLSTQ